MDTITEKGARAPPAQLASPAYPSTAGEFITLLAHYHRAEIARMAGWRDRIDHTSNWAITVAGAMLSVSLSSSSAHHGVLIFAMVLVMLLLLIESRRYRFFDVYRRRVRSLERNYFAQMLSPRGEPEHDWARILSEDLRRPRFQISLAQAMSRRLKRNYCWLFLILLLAWLLKITSASCSRARAWTSSASPSRTGSAMPRSARCPAGSSSLASRPSTPGFSTPRCATTRTRASSLMATCMCDGAARASRRIGVAVIPPGHPVRTAAGSVAVQIRDPQPPA